MSRKPRSSGGGKRRWREAPAETRNVADAAPATSADRGEPSRGAARSRDYQSRYPGPAGLQDRIVLADGSPVGRLLTARDADGLVIVDVALLPDYRGKGIGSTLLRTLLAEADAEMTVVHLFVTQTNPAIRLYRRLGFSEVSQIVPYVLMKWRPSHAPKKMR